MKTLSDEVLRELWRVKDENAKRFNYDLSALFDDLRRRETRRKSRRTTGGKPASRSRLSVPRS
ncbi:MAG: hypothetical protein A3K19_23965 [Lentisphaerae bacterium RIFOXYB12_FULL_65_16]|nr:MAG: hypothetical protein A3K18_10320 [Lentisphaerae bacterium RIFOXYA12_64_32]OGV89575.1 MAG: hypothetical protein A3K19_23965 [Lentisphaerae bacterium RIFOXYB12_FULL_65_16]